MSAPPDAAGGWLAFARRLRARLRHEWGAATVALVAVALHIAADVTNPLLYRELFDDAIPRGDHDAFRVLILLVVGLFALQVVAWAVRARALASLNARASARLRLEMLDRLRRMSLSAVSTRSVPGTLALFSKHLATLEGFLLVGGLRILVGAGQALVSFVLIFVVEWRLALVVVLAAPLSSLGTGLAMRRVDPLLERRRLDAERVAGDLHAILTTQPVVRAFTLWPHWRDRFSQGSKALLASTRRVGLATLATQAATVMGSRLVLVVVIGAGAVLAMDGAISAGSLIGFLALMLSIVMGVELVSESAADAISARESLAAIDELLAEDEAHGDEDAGRDAPPLSGVITLEGLRFGYADGAPVLDGVDLTIRRGESVALVGPSGSGKSTVLGVLLGFNRPQAGALRWDGADTRELAMASLRRQMGVVFQDTMLFELSVRDNIAMGRLDATDEEVAEAARAAEIHEVIAALPEGYHTVLTKGRLSGGQQQRIALARALVRRPEVLLLDEATSALDPHTEAAINATLSRIGRGRTVVSVTHRLAGVRDYDRIVVLRGGRVVEQGSHDALVAQGGLYAEMLARQQPLAAREDGGIGAVDGGWLRRMPVFEGLDAAALEALARRFVVQRCRDGEAIVREGEPGHALYVVARGEVVVSVAEGRPGPDAPPELEIGRLVDGDYFGETALLHDAPRAATVTARGDCRLLVLDRPSFERLLAEHPGARARIEAESARRCSIHAELRRAGALRRAPEAPRATV